MTLRLFVLLTVFMYSCSKCQPGALLGSASKSFAETISFSGKTVTFIGNSITNGARSTTARWTTQLAKSKEAVENNLGINGQVLQFSDSACGRVIFDKSTMPVYNTEQAALFISLGTNDIGMNNGSFTADKFAGKLDSVVQYAHNTKGWPYGNIVLLTPCYMNATGYTDYQKNGCGVIAANGKRHLAYVNAVVAEAKNRHTVLANVYQAMVDSGNPDQYISFDGVHPTQIGHDFIAKYLKGLVYVPQ